MDPPDHRARGGSPIVTDLSRPRQRESLATNGPTKARLYSLLLLMVFFWSMNFVIARIALREIPSLLTASLRAIFAGLFLLPLYFWKGRAQDRERWSRSDLPVLLFLGFVGVALNQVCFLSGYARTSTGHAAIVIGLTPLLVLVTSATCGLERLTTKKSFGILVALAGIGLLQLARGSGGQATLLGDMLVLGASVTFALFTVLGKQLTARHGGLTINTFAYVSGGLMLFPVVAWHTGSFDFSQVSAAAWISLLYMAVFPSAVCYLIFYWALTHIPATRVSSFAYLQPVLATLFGVVLLGDQITATLVAGGSLVLTGVFLTERG
ncbi:MAG: EamA family transporter [Acidobacteria bacterium]|nr:EamA family transporter [Acidobacteriota bacterium]